MKFVFILDFLNIYIHITLDRRRIIVDCGSSNKRTVKLNQKSSQFGSLNERSFQHLNSQIYSKLPNPKLSQIQFQLPTHLFKTNTLF